MYNNIGGNVDSVLSPSLSARYAEVGASRCAQSNAGDSSKCRFIVTTCHALIAPGDKFSDQFQPPHEYGVDGIMNG